MLTITLVLTLVAVAHAKLNNSSTCVQYYKSCTGTSNAGSQNCCNYPAVICLPDAQNGTSCLSPLDLVNISPQLTGLTALASLFQGQKNTTNAISDLVQINGQTVFNRTELLKPSTAAYKG